MGVKLHFKVIDLGRRVAEGTFEDETYDGIVFDYQELLKDLTPSQWVCIPERMFIPDSHRQAFV